MQNGPVQSYTITVFEVTTNTTTQEHQDFLHSTIILVGLHPNYDYDISVAAYTVGLGPSTTINLSTLEDGEFSLYALLEFDRFFLLLVPSGPPNSVVVTVANSTSATVTWTEPNAEDQNGNIKHYLVTLSGPDGEQSFKSTGLSIQLSDLHPYYTYTCKVNAVTIGSGPYSNVTFTTPQDGEFYYK